MRLTPAFQSISILGLLLLPEGKGSFQSQLSDGVDLANALGLAVCPGRAVREGWLSQLHEEGATQGEKLRLWGQHGQHGEGIAEASSGLCGPRGYSRSPWGWIRSSLPRIVEPDWCLDQRPGP